MGPGLGVWGCRGVLGALGGCVGKARKGSGTSGVLGCSGMGPWGGEGAGHWSWERGLRGFIPGGSCQCGWGSVLGEGEEEVLWEEAHLHNYKPEG